MTHQDLIIICKNLVLEGKAYHEIKAHLEQMSIEKQLIKAVLLETDELIATYQLAEQRKEKYLIQIIIGSILLLIGLAVTILSSFLLSGQVFAYGAILSGAWIIKEGYKKYKAPPTLLKIQQERKNKFSRF